MKQPDTSVERDGLGSYELVRQRARRDTVGWVPLGVKVGDAGFLMLLLCR